jgi:DNA-binding NtrC family response regulator
MTMATGATTQATPAQERILIVSANADYRKQLLGTLDRATGLVEEALSGAHALAKLQSFACDALLLDRRLPDLNPVEIAELVQRQHPGVEVRFVDSLAESASSVPASVRVEPEVPAPAEPECLDGNQLPGMVGTGRAMQEMYRLARLVAGRDTTVLITGETGTGKELVARAIHRIGPRAKNPLVVVNCAAIPETLLEAELFGHARGAFTGAVQSRLGRIHVAHGGTLFLDEIGELPLTMQSKLLRFLQDGEVQRLGTSDVFRVDVRVICATNVQLLDNVKQKLFRQDLYYRLAVFPIELPPLREHNEDIAPLAEQFLGELCRQVRAPAKKLSVASLAMLRRYAWPGNVRELQHSIERAFILSGEQAQIHVEHFSRVTDASYLRGS